MNGAKALLLCAVVVSSCVSHARAGAESGSQVDRVQFVGSYSQLSASPQHVYGYELELWRDGKSVVALWSRARGQAADFPIVLVSDLQWNESSGSVRFTAQWCDETESFDGLLNDREAVGTIISRTRSGVPSEPTKVVMPLQQNDRRARPRAEWKALIDKIVRTRGPKC